MWKVPLADLDFDQAEENAVLEVLHSRWLTMGEITQAFEKEFAEFTRARHAIAVTNATVALHLACLALGIGPGDEVIVPSLTFVASANSILYTGAHVRFADIVSSEELNIDPEAIESLITPGTRAVMVVHYGGYPCRMEKILELAKKYNLKIIEDAAHAPGAYLHRKHLGTWGDVGCFSFFSNKNMATGEGGMIVTDDDEIAQKVRLLRSHGMTSLTWDRHKGHSYSYDVVALGYNYRMDEMRAAIGRVQLKKLLKNNQKRKEITAYIRKNLAGCGITFPFEHMNQDTGISPSYHILPVLLPERVDRQAFMNQMKTLGVQTSIHYPPVHQFQFYQKAGLGEDSNLIKTEEVGLREVTLPLFPSMTSEQIHLTIDAVMKSIQINNTY